MKSFKKILSDYSLVFMIAVMLLIVVGIVIANIFWQTPEDWRSLAFDLMSDLISAICVGLVVATFTKIISNHIFKVTKNDRKLKSFGIDAIGGGKSTQKDTYELFGHPRKKEYPCEVKLFFITGNGFLSHFQKDIENYLRQPDTVLKIMMVNYSASNTAYLARMEEICRQDPCYKEQILTQSIPTLRKILANTGADPSRIQLRFFKDEYRYNYRVAKYDTENGAHTACWWNVQPFNRDAVDLSIMLHGTYKNGENAAENVVAYLNSGFDFLFDKYEHTQFHF